MSLTAIGRNGKVAAAIVEKNDGPFECDFCHDELILKKPRIRIDHFAHYPGSSCALSEGETYAHLFSKQCIYDALKANGIAAELEKWIAPDVRADILIQYNPFLKAGIELQRSKITLDDCIYRTEKYERAHIPVLWIAVRSFSPDMETHVSAQERLFHGMYFGKLPVYNPLQDSGSLIEIWHMESIERLHDGYTYNLKTIKMPGLIGHANLSNPEQFKITQRKAWKNVPGGYIFCP